MRYLVTGGAGFIGSHLVDALAARGDDVIVLDDLSTGRLSNLRHAMDSGSVEFVEGSVLDTRLVDDCMASADACLHLASAVGVKLVVGKPLDSLLCNVRGNDIVISAAARHKRRLLFASTSEVYGKNSEGGLREDSDRLVGSPLVSRWSYATAKAFGEALARSYYQEEGARMVSVRLFNTVGPRQTGAYGMVVPRLVGQALRGSNLTVYGTGVQSRCFTHVGDVVRAITTLCDLDAVAGEAYNIGNPVETSIMDLAHRVIDRTNSDAEVQLVPYDEAYGDGFEELGRRQPDITAIRRLIGWEPTRSLDEILDDVIAYERAVLAEERFEQPAVAA